jgi:alcohol dehydrogenase
MTWQYHNPVRIVFSDQFIEVLIAEIDPSDRILLICEDRLLETEEFKAISSTFDMLTIVTEIEANPSFTSVDKAIEQAKMNKTDVMLAIGGGSVMDTAKIVRKALITDLDHVSEIVETDMTIGNNGSRFIAIPTTHGTSSELTKWATVWDKQNKKKYSVSDDANYPSLAIYDHHFVGSLPLNISKSTTLDALSHSFEALWNKNANPVSDHYAVKAIIKILATFDELKDPVAPETRKELLEACVYAGLAFSNTKTAAAHSISYPLTAYFDVPHGLACSFSLPALLSKVKDMIPEKIETIIKLGDYDNVDELMTTLTSICDIRLSEFGMTESDVDAIVEESNTKGRMDNYLTPLSRVEIAAILSEAI